MAPCILNRSTRWRQVVSFITQPFYPHRHSVQCQGPKAPLHRFADEHNLLPLPACGTKPMQLPSTKICRTFYDKRNATFLYSVQSTVMQNITHIVYHNTNCSLFLYVNITNPLITMNRVGDKNLKNKSTFSITTHVLSAGTSLQRIIMPQQSSTTYQFLTKKN